jgi:hypothetical protein
MALMNIPTSTMYSSLNNISHFIMLETMKADCVSSRYSYLCQYNATRLTNMARELHRAVNPAFSLLGDL